MSYRRHHARCDDDALAAGRQTRLAPGAPGGTTPVRLMNDDLAVSLAPGGRLDTLLSSAEFATNPAVDPDGQVGRALCLAVDPDLLVTVNAMTAGYVVDSSATTARAVRVGQESAASWLGRLRTLAKRLCVAPTPTPKRIWARCAASATRLNDAATTRGGDIVDQILGVTSARGATIFGNGPLTGGAVDLLNAQGPTVAVAAAALSCGGQLHRQSHHLRRHSATAVPPGGAGTVRSRGGRRVGCGRHGSRRTDLSRLGVDCSDQSRLHGRAPPGLDGGHVVARCNPARNRGLKFSFPDEVESTGRRRAGHTHRRGDSDSSGLAVPDRSKR